MEDGLQRVWLAAQSLLRWFLHSRRGARVDDRRHAEYSQMWSPTWSAASSGLARLAPLSRRYASPSHSSLRKSYTHIHDTYGLVLFSSQFTHARIY